MTIFAIQIEVSQLLYTQKSPKEILILYHYRDFAER